MDYINHEARQRRHQKIGLNLSKNRLVVKKSYFFTKILLTALIVGSIDFGNNYFLLDNNEEDFYLPQKIEIEDKTFVLDDDGFVLKKEVQNTERSKGNQNKIIEYIVSDGDTLESIAMDYEIKISTILNANPDISATKPLLIGKVLKILPIDGIFINLSEDTDIRDIANKYKVSRDNILIQNNLGTGITLLSKGTSLIIPGASVQRIREPNTRVNPFASDTSYMGKISKRLIKPCEGDLTQGFHRGHFGLDIANRKKGPILAAANGVVSFVGGGWNGGYGNLIVIDHGKGMQTLYGHNEKVFVKKGDIVKQGQTIAWMGKSGRVRGKTGIHLHFEVIINGKKRNPLAYF